MTDLTERLKAKGGVCAEYAEWDVSPCLPRVIADACIAALLDELDTRRYPCTEAELEEAIARAEQAEAEVKQLKHELAKFPPRRERIAELNAEVERLKWMLDEAVRYAAWFAPSGNEESIMAEVVASYEKEKR